jgi:hypothetical protein
MVSISATFLSDGEHESAMTKKIVCSVVKLLGDGELEISTRYAGDERSDPLPRMRPSAQKKRKGGREGCAENFLTSTS